MTGTFMLHVLLHWSEQEVKDISLLYFSITISAWFYSWISNGALALLNLNFRYRKKQSITYLSNACLGLPSQFLDPTLQSGKKISKWNCYFRLFEVLGFSGFWDWLHQLTIACHYLWQIWYGLQYLQWQGSHWWNL